MACDRFLIKTLPPSLKSKSENRRWNIFSMYHPSSTILFSRVQTLSIISLQWLRESVPLPLPSYPFPTPSPPVPYPTFHSNIFIFYSRLLQPRHLKPLMSHVASALTSTWQGFLAMPWICFLRRSAWSRNKAFKGDVLLAQHIRVVSVRAFRIIRESFLTNNSTYCNIILVIWKPSPKWALRCLGQACFAPFCSVCTT